ncbi:MAG TPA: tetratricopeptide repeat protein [Pyrinomonadaceae bacterium]|nr:tetratricopeptide repeat protein [Pyrinomonadaceae bacterium]
MKTPARVLARLGAGALIALCFVIPPFAQAQQPAAPSFQETLKNAEGATAQKDWKAAAGYWASVVAANPVNARFWEQFAQSLYQSKDYKQAIPAYQKALELGAGFPSNQAYNIACCYALLGDKEAALKWLEKAFEIGFRDLELAQKDSDLQSLHDNPRYLKLVGLDDVSKMTREQGWDYDLAMLEREVDRKGFAYGVFRTTTKAEFHDAVANLSTRVDKVSDQQMVVEIMKLMRSLGDGHTGLLLPPQQPDYARALPLQFYLFKEGMFVIAADPKYKDLLGAQVLRLGDHTVEEILKSLDQVISRDNELWPSQLAPYHLRSLPLLSALGLVSDIKKTQLNVRDATGNERVVTVEADSTHPNSVIWNNFPADWITFAQSLPAPLPLYLKSANTNYWFEYLPDSKVVYFQYNRVVDDKQEPLAALTERLFKFINEHDVEKLVIDMRWNNGGNTFLSQPLLYSLIKSDKINQKGKLFVIIGRRTFSAAQNTTTFFERHTKAIFVGEPTGSRPNFVGEETPFVLPYSKITVNISDLYWQSSWPMDYRTWIAPQLYTPPTFVAYRANRDPAMEAILAYKQ